MKSVMKTAISRITLNRMTAGQNLALALACSVSLSGIGLQALALHPSAREYYKEAHTQERMGNLHAAEEALRKAVALDPTDYLNYVKLAGILNQLGNTNEAIALYKRALELNSQDPMLQFSLGALYEQQQDYEKAESYYRAGLNRNPQYRFGLLNLARTLIQKGDYEEAVPVYQNFLERYPDHFEARKYLANVLLVTKKPQEAAQEYEVLKRKFPERFSDHVNLARALTRSDAPEAALDELKVAYAKAGNKVDILEEMGHAHEALKQGQYAVQNYKKVVELDPKRYDLLLKVADIHQNQKQTDEAIAAYRKFLLNEPENLGVRHNLAVALMNNQQFPEALKELETVLAETTNLKDKILVRKEMAYSHQMAGNLNEAIRRYEALLNDPQAQAELEEDWQMKLNLALAYHKAGQLEKAAAYYKTVFYASPNPEKHSTQDLEAFAQARESIAKDLTNTLVLLGDEKYKAKQLEAALVHYGEATLYATKSEFAPYLGIANTYYALNMDDKAAEAYKNVLERNPENATAQLYLAKLDLRNQNPTASLPSLQKLAGKNPDNIEIQTTLAEAYLSIGDPAQAALVYEKLLTLHTESDAMREKLLISQGNTWLQLGSHEKAQQAYEAALAINPNNAMTQYNLGITYNELGNLDQSVKAYKEAIKLDPTYVDSYYGLAISLEKQQKYQEAIESYQSYTKQPHAQYFQQAAERIQLLKEALVPTQKSPAQNAPAQPTAPEVQPPLSEPMASETSADRQPITSKVEPPVETQATQNPDLVPLVQPEQATPIQATEPSTP